MSAKGCFMRRKGGLFFNFDDFEKKSAKIYNLFIIFRCVKKTRFFGVVSVGIFGVSAQMKRVNRIYSVILGTFSQKNQVAKFTKMHKNRVIFEKNGAEWVSVIYFFCTKFVCFPNATKRSEKRAKFQVANT